MAIIITTQPPPLQPAYNPNIYVFSGSNYTNQGYRYIVDIYSGNSTTLISRQRVSPLIDFSGKIDISRILATYLSVDFDNTSPLIDPASNSFFNYTLKLGEEYNDLGWSFSGNSTFSAGTQTKLTSTSANTHSFSAGTKINIVTLVSGNTINGLHTILSVPDNKNIIINVPYTGVTNTSGTTTYADNRKVIFSGLTTLTGQTVFNGVVSFKNYFNYSANLFTLNNTNTFKQALTDLPLNNFYINDTQSIWLNWYIDKRTPYEYNLMSEIPSQIGAIVLSTVPANNLKEIVQFRYSINDTPYDFNDTPYVDIYIARSTGSTFEQMSAKYRIWNDKRCRINEYQIAFQDRMGSIGSFAFQLRDKETGTIKRIQYNQQLGISPITTDRGYTNIWVGVEKELELNTDWMNEEMSIYFEQLLTSPYQYIKIGELYYACIISDTTFEVQHQRNKRLIRQTIKIKMANSDSINI